MPRSNVSFRDWCLMNGYVDLLTRLVNSQDANYSYASHEKVLWRCEKGHQFKTDFCKFTNKSRNYRGVGQFSCPVCSGQLVVRGINDLATVRPDLASEFDLSRSNISPYEVTVNSHRYVWWLCHNGHSWEAKIYARASGEGCPFCSKVIRTSRPEQILYYYTKKWFSDTQSNVKYNGVSFDIYIPSKQTAIEYDGSYWHSIRDTSWKFKAAQEFGIQLYVVSGKFVNDTNYFCFDDKRLKLDDRNNELLSCISRLLKIKFGIKESFDDYESALAFARDAFAHSRGKVDLPVSFSSKFSNLNGYDYQRATNDGVDKLWRCSKGHIYSRRIDVINRGFVECPFCLGKQLFRFWYLGCVNGLFAILDLDDSSVDFLDLQSLITCINVGINIKGVTVTKTGDLDCSFDYLLSLSLDQLYKYLRYTIYSTSTNCQCQEFVADYNSSMGLDGNVRIKLLNLYEMLSNKYKQTGGLSIKDEYVI